MLKKTMRSFYYLCKQALLALNIAAAVLWGTTTTQLGADAARDFTHPKLIRNLQSNWQNENYIVVLRPGVGNVRVAARAVLDRNNGASQQPNFFYEQILKGFSVEVLPDHVLRGLLDDVDVEYIEQVGRFALSVELHLPLHSRICLFDWILNSSFIFPAFYSRLGWRSY